LPSSRPMLAAYSSGVLGMGPPPSEIPANRIDAATGRERDDQRDRTGGIVLGHRGRTKSERNERHAEQSGSVIQRKHCKNCLRESFVYLQLRPSKQETAASEMGKVPQ
jgi:hypothetical protein